MSFQEETCVHGWACNVIMDQERGAAEIKIRPNNRYLVKPVPCFPNPPFITVFKQDLEEKLSSIPF
jgi:hypothetical protein